MKRYHITIKGIVQGVGFRPFVFNLAESLGLKGYVTNTTDGVIIDVEGNALDEFIEKLEKDPPPLSTISGMAYKELPFFGYHEFKIETSKDHGRFTLISPDVSICGECLHETLDKKDRRYLYPFTNCTNCGPRYSITLSVPYDRPNTTMKHFLMCKDCSTEYNNPRDRRFHAQPIACPKCGPQVELRVNKKKNHAGTVDIRLREEAVKEAIKFLKNGAVLAIKGLGGFHIACDATNDEAVKKLRERKRKNKKPFALMSPDMEMIKKYARVSSSEEKILTSRQAPIVILKKRYDHRLPEAISPNNNYLGFMLPYTPLHHLLFYFPLTPNSSLLTPNFNALVMTSGNLSEEPIVKDDNEALKSLSYLMDAYLLHNRDIFMRVDDSVVRVVRSKGLGVRSKTNSEHTTPDSELPTPSSLLFIRRARGYVPQPINLFEEGPDLLATGADLKNTFTLTKGSHAIVSQHIGDMENYETQLFFEEVYGNLKSVYRVDPVAIAFDMHPGYFSTIWAKKQGLKAYPVQHHHAHIASVMAENKIKKDVIGIAFDGSGYGTDGILWGSEVHIAGVKDFERFCHFDEIPLLGGEMAIKQPWRVAVSLIVKAFGDGAINCFESLGFMDKYGFDVISNLIKIREDTSLSPLSSGAGRIFDAVSAMLGICDENTFEGEAAMALEAKTLEDINESYGFSIINSDVRKIDFAGMIQEIVADILSGIDIHFISTKFHNTMVKVIVKIVKMAHRERGLRDVALSGGVFQNMFLLKNTVHSLTSEGFTVFFNKKVPANDGGISLGQAYILRERLK